MCVACLCNSGVHLFITARPFAGDKAKTTYSVMNGAILLFIAFLISPLGLPLLAVKMLGGLNSINTVLKNCNSVKLELRFLFIL